MSTDDATPQEREGWISKVLTFRGSIGRKKFLLGLLVEIGVLIASLAGIATLTSPTGGAAGAAFLGVIFFLLAFYLHMCLITARLRDAGFGYPVLLSIIIAILPFGWLLLTIELVETALAIIIPAGFLVLYFGPALPQSKAAAPAQS